MAQLLIGYLALAAWGALGEADQPAGSLPALPESQAPPIEERAVSGQSAAALQHAYAVLLDDKAALLAEAAPVLRTFAAHLTLLYGNSTSPYAGQVTRLAAELEEVASSLAQRQQNRTQMQRFARDAGAPNRSINVVACVDSLARTVGTLGTVQYARVQAREDCASDALSRDPDHCAIDLLHVVEGLALAVGDMAQASGMCVHIGGQSLRSMACAQVAGYTLQRLLTSVLEGVVAHHWCLRQNTTHATLTCKKAVAQVIYNAADAMRWAHAGSTHCAASGQAAGWQSQASSRLRAWSSSMTAELGAATEALQKAAAASSSSAARVPDAVRELVLVVNGSLGSLDADLRQFPLADARASSFVEQLGLYLARLPGPAAVAVRAAAALF